MYIPAILFVLACYVYAWYSHWSIKRDHKWRWHLLQWLAAALFLVSAFLFGLWCQLDFTFRGFGSIVSAAVLGIPVYVFTLHKLNDNYKQALLRYYQENEEIHFV